MLMAQKRKSKKEYSLILYQVTSRFQFPLQLWHTEEANNLLTQNPNIGS